MEYRLFLDGYVKVGHFPAYMDLAAITKNGK